MTSLAWLVAILVGMTAALVTIATVRAIQRPASKQAFHDGLSVITSSEFDVIERPSTITRWNTYWWEREQRAGRHHRTEKAAGITAAAIPLAAALLGITFGLTLLSLVGAALSLILWRGYLTHLAAKRVLAMEKQLPDLLQALRAHLHGGVTPRTAIANAAEDLASPLGDEIRKLRDDIDLNVNLSDALQSLTQRTGSREMAFLAASVDISDSEGGVLEPQLAIIEDVTIARTQTRQKLASALASVRPTQIIALLAIPGMYLFSFSNELNQAFWLSPPGLAMTSVVALLYITLMVILRRMAQTIEKS